MADTTTDRPPIVDRPAIPAEYGVKRAKDFVDWSHVERRLREARVYWVATAGTGRQPHVRPVDGLYHDGVVYVGGSLETRWIRDLIENHLVTVHLDGTDDVVIVEGEAEILDGVSEKLAQQLAEASNAKFGYGMTTDSFRTGPGPVAIRPRKVLAWTEFMSNPTRFRFE
jgi:nitroimidazol reductase NimA-like FMN-containing flavoprotein (pyridoxamine 5'-phosphate oxidase superfamily)